jgi:hypothetical protein
MRTLRLRIRGVSSVTLGGMFLLAHVLLAKVYWFSVPFAGVVLAFVSYVAAIAIAWSPTAR